ncbi:MAG TPA: VOC family protein [Halioglobus sp.]
MNSLFFPDQQFMQICWVVPDLRVAINNWVSNSGVGPFFVFDTVAFENPLYRGQPTDCPDISAAMAQAGDIQIELVCQHDDHPSLWRDVVPVGETGLHHLALYCGNYEENVAAYTRQGAEIAFSGLMMGSRVCWVDTRPTLGFMVELIEANDVADAVFANFRDAAEAWDGKDPVRSLS